MNDKSRVKRIQYQISNRKQIYLLNGYKFHLKPEIGKKQSFAKPGSLRFSISPGTLSELATDVVRKFKLPEAFYWTCGNIQNWIESIGYLEYKETFQKNFINGHTLILVDASALSKMNIKNHLHIRHITKAIRKLYGLEITNYFRNIFPPFHHLWTQYLLHLASRASHSQKINAIDFWKKFQILQPKQKYDDHWQILEIWLKNPKLLDTSQQYFIGCAVRSNLYKTKKLPNEKLKIKESSNKYSNVLRNEENKDNDINNLVVSSLEYDRRMEMLEKAKLLRIVKQNTKKQYSNECICDEDPCRCLSFFDYYNCIPTNQPKSFILSTFTKENKSYGRNDTNNINSMSSNISKGIKEKLLMILPTITDNGDDFV